MRVSMNIFAATTIVPIHFSWGGGGYMRNWVFVQSILEVRVQGTKFRIKIDNTGMSVVSLENLSIVEFQFIKMF